ncbi:MAG: PEP-CTERM sorting domain-containing protein, partial [Planctomycetales bacterium]|nr:PEP-CTERM sorting domain-containing protein [Planctomycetales bacterium]
QSDYQDDQQTGNSRSASDIVGDASNPAFFMQFDDGGTAGTLTDGNLLFRVRLGAAGGNSTPAFDRNLFVGLDGDGNGSLDLYLGVHNQGSADELGIYGPGTDLNTSPNTTSITGPLMTFAESPTNYSFTSVDTTDLDIDADGELDYFLSFAMPFQSVVDMMLAESGIAIDQYTAFGFVMATATQDNSFNQDINGLPKSFSKSATWTSLGAISIPLAPVTAVPEPSTFALLGMFTLTFVTARRRRRNK